MQNIVEILSQCRTIGDVQSHYASILHCETTARDTALLYYIKSWIDYYPTDHPFNKDKFISDDLSAVLYKDVPLILFGSNNWAEKRYLPKINASQSLKKWSDHIVHAVSSIGKPVFIVIVPEKDEFVRRIECAGYLRSDFFEAQIAELLSPLESIVSGWIFNSFSQVNKRSCLENYKYYDTHLLSQDYVSIYNEAVSALFNVKGSDVNQIVYEEGLLYGDLDIKLKSCARKENFLYPKVLGRTVSKSSGSDTFADPLRATWQSFACSNAPIKGRVAIFGDSHSSIYVQKKLTYLFANTCDFCDFYWDPFCISGDFSRATSADYVVFEISERFLF